MLGAIAGDIIGSRFEFNSTKDRKFELFHEDCTFTDDTILTVAVAESLMSGIPFVESFHRFYEMYPDENWGTSFEAWASERRTDPYNSWANGAATRVSGFSWKCDRRFSLEEVKPCVGTVLNGDDSLPTPISLLFPRWTSFS